jgi:CHAD domain-containing protein
MAGVVAAPAKASKPRIRDDMTIRAAFRAIGRACLHDFTLNVAALDGPDPIEAVHQGRVAIRRLRAALALVKPLTFESDHAKMNARLRALAQIFGAARDRDVLRARGVAEGGDDFSDWIEARRLAAHEAVRKAVDSKRWRMFLIDFSEWIEMGAWRTFPPDDQPVMFGFVRKRLRRRRKALLHRAQDLARLDGTARHKVRIEAKKLRYMAQFFMSVSGLAGRKRLERALASLDKLQSALGDLRDAEARPAMAQSEIRLWRSAAGNVDAASLAAAERFASPVGDSGAYLDKALKACADLARTDPFPERRSDYRFPPKSSNKRM